MAEAELTVDSESVIPLEDKVGRIPPLGEAVEVIPKLEPIDSELMILAI